MAHPKQIVRRYLTGLVDGGRVELAEELVAPDLVFTSPYTPEPTRDREGFAAMISGLHAAFPDFFLREEETIAEGELVASRWVAGGTHTGADLNGVPASGRRFEIAGMSLYRVRDGRIVEGWVIDDTLGMAAQLGLVSLPEPPA